MSSRSSGVPAKVTAHVQTQVEPNHSCGICFFFPRLSECDPCQTGMNCLKVLRNNPGMKCIRGLTTTKPCNSPKKHPCSTSTTPSQVIHWNTLSAQPHSSFPAQSSTTRCQDVPHSTLQHIPKNTSPQQPLSPPDPTPFWHIRHNSVQAIPHTAGQMMPLSHPTFLAHPPSYHHSLSQPPGTPPQVPSIYYNTVPIPSRPPQPDISTDNSAHAVPNPCPFRIKARPLSQSHAHTHAPACASRAMGVLVEVLDANQTGTHTHTHTHTHTQCTHTHTHTHTHTVQQCKQKS